MAVVKLELPDDLPATFQGSPEALGREVRLAAAIHWYVIGRVSQETAARVAGLDRSDFLFALAAERQNAFVVDWDGLKKELGSD